jgi:hypothetical protein
MKNCKKDAATPIPCEKVDIPGFYRTHQAPIGEETPGWPRSDVTIKISEIAVEKLGPHGRVFGMSKDFYREEHPGHEVFFNACIFDARALGPERGEAQEIWFGDIDLTEEAEALQEVADQLGAILVTSETPFRFRGLPPWPRSLEGRGRVRVFRSSR